MLMMLARLYGWAVTGVSSSTRGVRTDPTDAQLIDAALSGDAKAFETLLRRNLDAMYAIALRITLDEADTDDVVKRPACASGGLCTLSDARLGSPRGSTGSPRTSPSATSLGDGTRPWTRTSTSQPRR